MAKNIVSKIIDRLPQIKKSFESLSTKDVFVGVPREETSRKPDEEEIVEGMTNAALLYIHNNGSPAANIPARPVMEPGIQAAKGKIVNAFKKGAKGTLDGDSGAVDKALNTAGLMAQDSIRNEINNGPPPALAESTLAARKRKGIKSTKPLVVTAQMRNSVNYVIREK